MIYFVNRISELHCENILDSLLYNDTPCVDVCDAETCFNMQCNQVFIGMVTMQYQPQSDMVRANYNSEYASRRNT